MLTVVAAAGAAAYFVNSKIPFADTVLGGIIGASMGFPWVGLITGALVPDRGSGARLQAALDKVKGPLASGGFLGGVHPACEGRGAGPLALPDGTRVECPSAPSGTATP